MNGGWIDRLAERIGKKSITEIPIQEYANLPDVKEELEKLEILRQSLVQKDIELERERLEWDRTFDSITDHIVLIDIDRRIRKANNAFWNCVETEIGHMEIEGMYWSDFTKIAGLDTGICVVDACLEKGLHQEKIIRVYNKVYSVSVNPVYIDTPTGKVLNGVVRVSRDVTTQEKIKTSMARRSSIYHAISEMTKKLVNHTQWDNAVNLTLGDLGRAIGASRVYIYKNALRENRMCALKQQCYHNLSMRSCEPDNISECVNYDLMPEWETRMSHGLSVEGTIEDCGICPNMTNCTCQNEVLVCAVPIFVAGKWWGFMGFEYTNGTRVWKDEDKTLLRIAADIMGGTIYHRGRYYNAVNKLEEQIVQEEEGT